MLKTWMHNGVTLNSEQRMKIQQWLIWETCNKSSNVMGALYISIAGLNWNRQKLKCTRTSSKTKLQNKGATRSCTTWKRTTFPDPMSTTVWLMIIASASDSLELIRKTSNFTFPLSSSSSSSIIISPWNKGTGKNAFFRKLPKNYNKNTKWRHCKWINQQKILSSAKN